MFAAGSCFCFDMIFSIENSCFPLVILKFEFHLKKSHCVVIFYINEESDLYLLILLTDDNLYLSFFFSFFRGKLSQKCCPWLQTQTISTGSPLYTQLT